MQQSKLNIEDPPIDTEHLFEQLCTKRLLLEGWREVKKSRGTSGSDGQTIDEFNARLYEEIKQLKNG